MNSSQLLALNARKYPQTEAIIGMGKRYTYQELDKLVNRFAHGLKRKGLKEGDKAVLFMPNVPGIRRRLFCSTATWGNHRPNQC